MSSLTEKLIAYLKKQILTILISNLKKKLKNLIKAATLTIIGYAIIILGLIFTCLGVIKYLSEVLHLPLWCSLITSGVTLLLIGVILFLISYYKLKFW
jgi:tetrahydromethanopterin S-methyltransferase subunit C